MKFTIDTSGEKTEAIHDIECLHEVLYFGRSLSAFVEDELYQLKLPLFLTNEAVAHDRYLR